MTREEAIKALAGAWQDRDSDHCASREEYACSEKEMCDAFYALGVTYEEITAPTPRKEKQWLF